MSEYYFDIFRAKPRHFWTRIKARNGKILWASEVITTKQNALRPVKKLVSAIGKKKCVITYYDKINNTSEVI